MLFADLFRILVGLFLTLSVLAIINFAAIQPFLTMDITGFRLTQTRSGIYTTGVPSEGILTDTRRLPFTAAHVVMLPTVDAEILRSRMEIGAIGNIPGAGGQAAEHIMGARHIRLFTQMVDLAGNPTRSNLFFKPRVNPDTNLPFYTLTYHQTLASMHNRQITLIPWQNTNLGHPYLDYGRNLDTRFNIMVQGYGQRSTIHFFTGPKPERLIWGLHSPLD